MLKLDEKWKFYVALKIAFWAPSAPFILKTVRDTKKNRLKKSESSHLEKSNEKKIPSKLDEKLKFYVAPKIAFYLENGKKYKKIGWTILKALT